MSITLTRPTVHEALTQPLPITDQYILVDTQSIPESIRREFGVNGWKAKYLSFGWCEAYAPSDGCNYGCKVYARRYGAVVRWAVIHSTAYGHTRRSASYAIRCSDYTTPHDYPSVKAAMADISEIVKQRGSRTISCWHDDHQVIDQNGTVVAVQR